MGLPLGSVFGLRLEQILMELMDFSQFALLPVNGLLTAIGLGVISAQRRIIVREAV